MFTAVLLHDTLVMERTAGGIQLQVDGAETRILLSVQWNIGHSCDANRVLIRHDADGSLLDVGRKTRTIPLALRRALDARDRGCRFPGCGLRFTDAHHIVHWADGGETKLESPFSTTSGIEPKPRWRRGGEARGVRRPTSVARDVPEETFPAPLY